LRWRGLGLEKGVHSDMPPAGRLAYPSDLTTHSGPRSARRCHSVIPAEADGPAPTAV